MPHKATETLAVIDATVDLPTASAFLKMTEHATLMEIQRDKASVENEALRDALRVRIGFWAFLNAKRCPECNSGGGHYKTCRHAATEREVMK